MYIKALDGVRAIAILLVLFWHYLVGPMDPEFLGSYGYYFKKAFAWTWSGVDLFFILSGFLIGKILIEQRESPRLFKTFFYRRACRIMPAYFFVVFFYLVCIYSVDGNYLGWLLDNPKPLYSYLFLIQNYWMGDGFGAPFLSVTWSLAVEEQFYLIFPFIVYLTSPKHRARIFMLGVVIAPIYRQFLSDGYEGYVFLPARIDALFAGALVAHYYLKDKPSFLLCQKKTTLLFVSCLGVVLYVLGRVIWNDYLGSGVIHTATILFFTPLLLMTLSLDGQNIPFLKGAISTFFSRISYMLYLVHLIVLGIMFEIFASKSPSLASVADFIIISCAFLVSLILCHISFKFFEKPIIDIGKRRALW